MDVTQEQENEELIKKLGKGVKLFNPKTIDPLLEQQFQRQNAQIKDEAGIVEWLTKVSVLPESVYHLFVPKELSLANLTKADRDLVDLHVELINRGIYMAKKGWIHNDIPFEDAVKYITFLNATRAEGMQHEKLMAEHRSNVTYTEELKTPSWRDRYLKKTQG